ncbi:MAG: DUF1223 domain-containing protein [Rhodanobacter sp.]
MTLMTRLNRLLLLGICALMAFGVSGHAQERAAPAPSRLVVVELFQSQGCSSCPPAEANLNAIAGQPGILALSFGVTYWDSLGWKDTFATAAYTDRQWAYAHHRGRDNVWTPQVYVDGHADLVGTDRAQLDQVIAHADMHGPQLSWQQGQLQLSAGKPAATCDVWLVRYDPRTINVAIGAGENGGRTLPHRNVVRELVHLGTWDGSARTFAVPAPSSNGLSTAALVQAGSGGDILSASKQTAP